MPKSRLEAFSDGVFAIAITLLVLEVKLPGRGGETLVHQLLHQWPSYLSYVVSFMTIAIIWVNHHACFDQIGQVDRALLFLNAGLLLCVAFIPFPTSVVAEFVERPGDARAAAVLYGVVLTITAAFFNSLWQYAIRHPGIIREDADPRVVDGITRSFMPGLAIYATGTAIALISPIASVAVFGGIALFYMLPSARFARLPG